MTVSEFRSKTKEALDKVDKGEKVLIARGGKIYQIVLVS